MNLVGYILIAAVVFVGYKLYAFSELQTSFTGFQVVSNSDGSYSVNLDFSFFNSADTNISITGITGNVLWQGVALASINSIASVNIPADESNTLILQITPSLTSVISSLATLVVQGLIQQSSDIVFQGIIATSIGNIPVNKYVGV